MVVSLKLKYSFVSGLLFILTCMHQNYLYATTIDLAFEHVKEDPKALYSFLQQMPKAGELHAHFDGSANFDTLIRLAKQGKYCIDPKTFTLSRPLKDCAGVPIQTFLENPAHSKQLRADWSMETLQPDDSDRYDHFFNIFQKVSPIYQDFTIPLLVDMIQHAAKQHELYLEIIMQNPRQQGALVPEAKPNVSLDEKKKLLLSDPSVQQLIDQQIFQAKYLLKQTRQALGCKKHPQSAACQVTVKFQYFVLREKPPNEVFSDALIGFVAASQSKDIVGINMVQPEKGPKASGDFKQHMQFLSFLHQAYPSVNISLHAGELTSEMAQNKLQHNHIQDSIRLGKAKRIGHGAALYAEDDYQNLVKQMASENIAVEINLTSNQDILSLTTAHPFPYYLDHQVPIVISTDDAGISETSLTQEFFKATERYHLAYKTIKQINRNALTYSFLPGKSLWLNASKPIIVPDCLDKKSQTCQQFIAKSQKAHLQWMLENELDAFEKQWATPYVSKSIKVQ